MSFHTIAQCKYTLEAFAQSNSHLKEGIPLTNEKVILKKILGNKEKSQEFMKEAGTLMISILEMNAYIVSEMFSENFSLMISLFGELLGVFECSSQIVEKLIESTFSAESLRRRIMEVKGDILVSQGLFLISTFDPFLFSKFISIEFLEKLAESWKDDFIQAILDLQVKPLTSIPQTIQEYFDCLATLKSQLYETQPIEWELNENCEKKVKIDDQISKSILNCNVKQISRLLFHSNLVAINGPQGSGKSLLAESIFSSFPSLTLYIDKTLDFKSLLGCYVCTETIGKFEWKAGPLKIAASQGLPLILENCQEMSLDLFHSIIEFIAQPFARGFKLLAVGNFSEGMKSELTKSNFLIHNLSEFTRNELASVCSSDGAIGKLFNEIMNSKNLKMRNLKALVSRSKFLESRFIASANYLTEKFRFLFLEELIHTIKPSSETLIQHVIHLSLENKRWECEPWEIGKIEVRVGRYGCFRKDYFGAKNLASVNLPNLIPTKLSSWLFERIFVCALHNEPCLLIGDTGSGKTTVTQFLAKVFNKKLHVFNLSSGSESTDLLGGYKPSDIKGILQSLCEVVAKALKMIFSMSSDSGKGKSSLDNVLETIRTLTASRKWRVLSKYLLKNVRETLEFVSKREMKIEKKVISDLASAEQSLTRLSSLNSTEERISFRYLEGGLIKALRKGHWVLIDEVNLASNDLLQKLLAIVDGKSITNLEKGESQQIPRHPNFRLFCCMNPGKDIGKKDLPANLSSKFSIIEVPEMLDRRDIESLVLGRLQNLFDSTISTKIVDFYLRIKEASSSGHLESGINKRAHISLRNLSRCLDYMTTHCSVYGRERVVYDGILLGFSSGLSMPCYEDLCGQVSQLFGIETKAFYANSKLFSFIVPHGSIPPIDDSSQFIVTERVTSYLIMVLRAVVAGLPVLLEGPTSAGKTSLVKHLAAVLGNKCVRINNHEHTSLEEYFGNYFPTPEGTLTFREGLLVQAVRNGHWLILDELNLAKSDILETLNRLLDDNRELFIPELQETLKPHPNFRLFATQNPSSYAGRKPLSKAFANRFQCLEFSQISRDELQLILEKRSNVAPSIAKKMLSVWSECQDIKSKKDVFTSEGLVTSRDLLKWASRPFTYANDIAYEGYFLLAERLRDQEEKELVKKAIEKAFKCELNPRDIYKRDFDELAASIKDFPFELEPNPSLQRMLVLLRKAVENGEAVLLVGETGGGKTTACQLLAFLRKSELFSLNCHKYSEAADFLGSLRPSNEAGKFIWQDGPLTLALRGGNLFLADEINLAEDSVLERLNSVLDDDRTIVLTEFCEETESLVKADIKFAFVATMNPGGDFGKKELSPALRNRFTEIWIESPTNAVYLDSLQTAEMVHSIVERSGLLMSHDISSAVYSFLCTFNKYFTYSIGLPRYCMTLRDVLAISQFFGELGGENWRGNLVEALDMLICDPLVHMDSSLRDEIIGEIQGFIRKAIQCDDFINFEEERKELVSKWISNKNSIPSNQFAFKPQIAQTNLYKLLRALKVPRAILLEGLPHAGKGKLVKTVGEMEGRQVVRFTLSEQLDISDLLGSDVPVSQGNSLHFEWRDGILLKCLKEGHWLVLEELNMASQSILEGLNSILDHRGEVFVPELGRSFHKHNEFRLFGTQSPHWLGGGRKGLPSSFLNRFVRVSVEGIPQNQISLVTQELFPSSSNEIVFETCEQALGYYCIRDKMSESNARSLIGLSTQNMIVSEDCPFFWENGNVMTNSIRRCWGLLKDAYSTGLTIHIEGLPSCGKKTMLNQFCSFYGNSPSFHVITPSTDCGDLIGGYEQKGQIFYWKWGIVTEALVEGKTLVLESKGKVNSAVFSRLSPLFERDLTKFLTPEAPIKEIERHKSFRLVLVGSGFEENLLSSTLSISLFPNQCDFEIISAFKGFPVENDYPMGIRRRLMDLEDKIGIVSKSSIEHITQPIAISWDYTFSHLMAKLKSLKIPNLYYSTPNLMQLQSIENSILNKILLHFEISTDSIFESSALKSDFINYLKISINSKISPSNFTLQRLINDILNGKLNLRRKAITEAFDAKAYERFISVKQLIGKSQLKSLLSTINPSSSLPLTPESFTSFCLLMSLFVDTPDLLKSTDLNTKRFLSQIKNSLSICDPKFILLIASASLLGSNLESSIKESLVFPSTFVYRTDYSQVIIKEIPLLISNDDVRFWIGKRQPNTLSKLVEFTGSLRSIQTVLSNEIPKPFCSSLSTFFLSYFSLKAKSQLDVTPVLITLLSELFESLEAEVSDTLFSVRNVRDESRRNLQNGFELDLTDLHLNEVKVLETLTEELSSNLTNLLPKSIPDSNSSLKAALAEFCKRVQLLSFLPSQLKYKENLISEFMKGLLAAMTPEWQIWRSEESSMVMYEETREWLESRQNRVKELRAYQRPQTLVDLGNASDSLAFLAGRLSQEVSIENLRPLISYLAFPRVFLSIFDVFNEIPVLLAREVLSLFFGEKDIEEKEITFSAIKEDFGQFLRSSVNPIPDLSSSLQTSQIFFSAYKSRSCRPLILTLIEDYLEKVERLKESEEEIENSRIAKKGLEKIDPAAFYHSLKENILSSITDEYTKEAVEEKRLEFIKLQNELLPSHADSFKLPKHLNTKEKVEAAMEEALKPSEEGERQSSGRLISHLLSLLQQTKLLFPPTFSTSLKCSSLIPNALVSMVLDLGSFRRSIQNGFADHINFYRDPCPKELLPLHDPLVKCLQRVSQLLEEEMFSGNEVLYEAAILSEKLLSMNLSKKPLSFAAAGLQELVQKIEEWNSNVPRIHEIGYTELLTLLFNFRKLQRSSWRFLLLHKRQELRETEAKFLTNILQAFTSLSSIDFKLFLDEFLNTCSIIGFEARLEILKISRELIPKAHTISNVFVMNEILAFYTAFRNTNLSEISSCESDHSTKLKECVKIAGWKSTSHLILRE